MQHIAARHTLESVNVLGAINKDFTLKRRETLLGAVYNSMVNHVVRDIWLFLNPRNEAIKFTSIMHYLLLPTYF